MRISLISPNLSNDIASLDLGLTALASYLHERTPHRAQLIDFTFHRKDWGGYLRKKLEEFKPQAVGIAAFSMRLRYVRQVASEIKSLYHLPVILGGYHPTLMPEESLAVEGVDAICIGDGEFTLAEYLDALEEKRSPEGIKGLWVKHNGQVLRNPLREWNQDLDSLPIPDYDLWEDIDKYLYYFGLCFVGNRGCPFSCTYCSEAALRQAVPGKRIRQRSPRAYAQEIKYQWEKYKKRGMEVALLYDPIFPFDKSWVREFCDEYQRLGLSTVLPFSCFIRADTVDGEWIKIMKAGNLRVARIGIEAGNDVIRREVYGKDIESAKFRSVCRLLRSHQIRVIGFNIIGGPHETPGTLKETFDLTKELRLDWPVFTVYTPLPKTENVENARALGYIIDQGVLSGLDNMYGRSSVSTKSLSASSISLFRLRCVLFFGTRSIFLFICRDPIRFCKDLLVYFFRGMRDRIGMRYILGHFFVKQCYVGKP